MGSQEFCLKWNNHHITLVSVLDRLLSSETLVDATLVAEGKSIRVHRVVLAACSTYFQDIVDLHQDKSLVIFLKDVKYVELQALVDYMYRGEVRVAQNSLASLIRTAESLKIKGLAEAEDESNPQENETPQSDRDTHSPGRKRRRRSGESNVKREIVPPAPPLQPAPVIQLKEEDCAVPVISTPRVVKQVPLPPALAPAIEQYSELNSRIEKNIGDYVTEYVSSNLDNSNHHEPSPVLPKSELSGDELGNDTDHGQEEDWNEEDFSALVSDQTGNSETGETSRSLQNSSQQGIVVAAASSDKKIVCYFTNWSAYRPGIAKFTASNINPYLCTHLVYAFVGMDSEFRLRPFDKWQDIDQGAYAKFNGLKTYNKELKTLLAIGGWNEGSKRFSLLAEDSELRKNFTKSVVRYLRQYQFDGFDLDWEYPGSRDGGRPEDKENYLRLVKDLRRAFESEAKKTKRPRLLLTMAVPAGIETIEKGYDVPRLSKYLDFFNLLSYDYHASTEPLVNHHSPLRSYDETDFEHQLTVEYTVRHYLKNGAPRHKIVVGIPTYGRAYKLFNPDVNGLESPSLGPSEASKYTKEKGYMAYYEICEKIGVENWLIEKPYPEDVGPYAYSQEGDWVGYDDEDMVARKANYVLEEDLGGIMFWSLETDDFRGVCTGKQYPLLEAGKEAIIQGLKRQEGGKSSTGLKKSPKVPSNNAVRSNSVLRSLSSVSPRDQSIGKESSDFNGVTQAIFRATPPTPPTPAPDADFTCKDEGFYAHPTDCKRYFRCLDAGALGIIPNAFVCPSGLYYNKLSGSCDYSTNVICKAPVTSIFKPFLASGTSLATRSPTTTSEPFLDYVDFSSEEKDIFDDSEEVVKSKEITRSEEDSETELEKLLDLIHELGGVSRVRQLLGKSKVSSSDPDISKEQRESLKKFLDTTASASNSRRGPVGGSVPKEILEKTDFDPTFNQHDTIDAKPRKYQTIRRNRPIPPSTSEDPSTTPVIEQFISQDSDEIETDFREEDELPVSPKDEFLDSYEYYEDDILSIKATPKSVNLQRRPSVIADISSEEAEVEIEIATRTSTTTEPATTVTTAEPTTTRRKLIRGPARRRFSSTITATTPETSAVERASVGPIRIRPPTSSKRRFVARPRSTTIQPIVEENDEVVETRDLNYRFPSPVDVEDFDDDEIIDESAEVSSVPSVTIVQSSEQVVVKSFVQKRPQPFTRLQRPSLPRRIADSPLRQRQQQPTPDPLLNENDADYYDESDDEVVDNFKENKLEKVKIVNGRVRCFDVGNFPYPGTCKKFINCARVDSGAVRAWVYTCPKELTFDPVGGLCNWGNPQQCSQ